MREAVVGFDTSNYRTSAAAVTTEGQILFNARQLLPVKEGERGLRQSDAVFFHVRQMTEVTAGLNEALAGCRIAAVAASTAPRNTEDSYMPVFKVGESQGRTLAAALGVPFYGTDHQAGHIRAAVHGTVLEGERDHLALHLSGGTTDLLRVTEGRPEYLGGTLDLNAGQLVDWAGVAMGLRFPAGPELEELALKGQARGLLGRSLDKTGLGCHFSGAETKVQQWIRAGDPGREDISAEIYDLLARTVLSLMKAGRDKTGCGRVLIAGGVAASALFRRLIRERNESERRPLEIVFGDPELSGDNAAGAALLGADRYNREAGGKE